jgi:hypothetical protein
MQAKQWRSINLETISELSIGKQKYIVV